MRKKRKARCAHDVRLTDREWKDLARDLTAQSTFDLQALTTAVVTASEAGIEGYLADALRNMLLAECRTPERIGADLGVSSEQGRRYLNGTSKPSFEKLCLMAARYGLNPFTKPLRKGSLIAGFCEAVSEVRFELTGRTIAARLTMEEHLRLSKLFPRFQEWTELTALGHRTANFVSRQNLSSEILMSVDPGYAKYSAAEGERLVLHDLNNWSIPWLVTSGIEQGKLQ